MLRCIVFYFQNLFIKFDSFWGQLVCDILHSADCGDFELIPCPSSELFNLLDLEDNWGQNKLFLLVLIIFLHNTMKLLSLKFRQIVCYVHTCNKRPDGVYVQLAVTDFIPNCRQIRILCLIVISVAWFIKNVILLCLLRWME